MQSTHPYLKAIRTAAFLALALIWWSPPEAAASPPDTAWIKTYGGPGIDYGFAVQQTRDGGYIMLCRSLSFEPPGYYIYLVKADAQGNLTWSRHYDGYAARCVEVVSTSGYLIIGTTHYVPRRSREIFAIRTDAVGVTDGTDLPAGVELAIPWNECCNGEVLESGVYFYLIASDAGEEGAGKALVIR